MKKAILGLILAGVAVYAFAQAAITITIPAQYTNALTDAMTQANSDFAAMPSPQPTPYPNVTAFVLDRCIGSVASPALSTANSKAKAAQKKAQIGDWCARFDAGNAGVKNQMCNALPGQGPGCDPVALGICAPGGQPPADALNGKISSLGSGNGASD